MGSMKLALVTGGAQGIGSKIARKLHSDGLRVAVVDVADPGEPLIGVSYYRSDVSHSKDVIGLTGVLEDSGGVDVLINNAAIRGPTAPVVAYPPPDWEEVLRVNLTGPFLCSQAFAPGMQRKGWGRIVNISSMAGKTPYPLRAGYASSKWGLIGLTLTLAQELGPQGITVNAVCPGPVENVAMESVIEQRALALGKSVDAVKAEYLRHLAIPRFPGEEDVAAMVSFLVSDAAWSITGQALEVSSGYRA
jgi:NAD(P)-dependent dehydrogenase (short-subunit alcohol dehydrogenase family)